MSIPRITLIYRYEFAGSLREQWRIVLQRSKDSIGMNESRLTHQRGRRGVRGRGIGDRTRLCEQRRMINELRSATSIVALLKQRIK